MLGCGVMALVLAWLGSWEREPTYQSKRLGDWIDSIASAPGRAQASVAEEAVRQIGTKAVPFLIKWMAQPPSKLRRVLNDLQHQKLGERMPRSVSVDHMSLRGEHASLGFRALGDQAGFAAPELLKELRRAKDPMVRLRFVNALQAIGPAGLVALCQVLTNYSVLPSSAAPSPQKQVLLCLPLWGTNAAIALPAVIQCLKAADTEVAADAAVALGLVGRGHAEALEALTNAISDPRPPVRLNAVQALQYFGADGRAAVPALLSALRDTDPLLRAQAIAALGEIAPEALGKPNAAEKER